MDRRRIGFVVSHPAHLLTVVGMVLRWRPQVLLLTSSAAPAAAGQGYLVRRGLAMIGLEVDIVTGWRSMRRNPIERLSPAISLST